jgi:hypothetical protein
VPEHPALDSRTDELLHQHLARRALYSNRGSQNMSQRMDILRDLERYVSSMLSPVAVSQPSPLKLE